MMYYTDFFQTWHKCQPYKGHLKTAIQVKRWGHRAQCSFTLCACNSVCVFPNCARSVRNLNNRQKVLFNSKNYELKPEARLFVWAVFFQLRDLKFTRS